LAAISVGPRGIKTLDGLSPVIGDDDVLHLAFEADVEGTEFVVLAGACGALQTIGVFVLTTSFRIVLHGYPPLPPPI
jgi:hypothetical protein